MAWCGVQEEFDLHATLDETRASLLVKTGGLCNLVRMENLPRLALFFILGFLARTVLAVEIVDGPRVEAAGSTATLRWKTDVECGARVRLGLAADHLDRKARTEGIGVDHVVVLDGLQLGTTYFFNVGTSRTVLAAGSFNSTGQAVAKDKAAPLEKKTPPPVRKAPPTKKIWGNIGSLQDHFDRHGRDFGAKTPDDYARLSWEFLNRAIDEGWPAKVDGSDGTIRVWDPKSRAFAAYNRNGTTKTYFKPGSSDYFERQPGKLTKLKRPE